MAETDKTGSSLRQQLESVWRQTGIKPKELEEAIELPVSCQLVWRIFLDLNRARGSNGFGVNPISYQELYSYCSLTNIQLEADELELLKRFDSTVLSVHSKLQEKEQKSPNKKKK